MVFLNYFTDFTMFQKSFDITAFYGKQETFVRNMDFLFLSAV